MAMGLLPADSWQSQYELTLSIYESTAECEYLNINFEESQKVINIVLKEAKTILEKVKTYDLQLQFYSANNRLYEALNIGINVLKLLGVSFPENPNTLNIVAGLIKTKLSLGTKRIEDLANLPEMTDPHKQAIMRIASGTLGSAIPVKPQLLPLLTFMMIEQCIKYGNSPYASIAYVFYGVILCRLENVNSGYQFGELGIRLLEKFQSSSLKSRVYVVFSCFIKHWKSDLNSGLGYLMESFQSGMETGDLESAGYAITEYCHHKLWMGEPLELVEQETGKYLKLMQQLKLEMAVQHISIRRQAGLNFCGKSVEPCHLVGESFNEVETLPALIEAKSFLLVCLIYNAKAQLNFFFKNYVQALDNSRLFAKYEEAAAGFYVVSISNFYYSLSLLALFPEAGKGEQKQYLKKVIQLQKKMKKWASYAPMNHQHKYDLVEAEKARVLGQKERAMDYYDRAIAGAQKNKYIQEEALAYELAGEFYESLGKDIISQAYLTKAYYAYIRWGALAKVKDLEFRYPFLVAQTRTTETRTLDVTGTTTGSTTTNGFGHFLDLSAFVKASQAITSEIVLEKLLTKLINILLENVAAKKVVLLLLKNDVLCIEATGTSTEDKVTLLPSIPVENCQDVPLSVINYVHRSQKHLVLDNATVTEPFNADAYIQKYQPKSILCLPIIYQSQRRGIIYLENALTVGAFTAERVEVLKVLVSQVAIAVENAGLYAREQEKSQQLEKSFNELQEAQLQLIQSEKMSALGNLIAGVAHEINNPLGFIAGNVDAAAEASSDLIDYLQLYQEKFPNPGDELVDKASDIDLEYLMEDLPKMLLSMKSGTDRIRNISTSLRTFSRADTANKVSANIHEGIDSTLLILQYRLKANDSRPAIQIIKEYGYVPPIKCYFGQLNQVFMNLLANAIDCFDEFNVGRTYAEIEAVPNTIAIITHVSPDSNSVVIRIKDNGAGMSPDVQAKIFDHLFTTKGVGKGTGLGLSISRQIVEETHGGKLICESVLGEGTAFAIALPLN